MPLIGLNEALLVLAALAVIFLLPKLLPKLAAKISDTGSRYRDALQESKEELTE
ncbi:MAG: hypothetical protein ABEI97_04410 [Candidatus Nanohaloarchaea archaeon]